MHIDTRTLDNTSEITGDICIVGAGAAGISMALEWIDSPYKVILLEGGGFDVEPRMQDLYRGENIGQRYYPLHSSRLHYFGGTTGHWAGYCSLLDAIDFKKRQWVDHSGWPLSLEDFIPYFNRAWKNVQLESAHFDLEYWLKEDTDLMALPIDDSAIWNKILQFSPPTRFGKQYRQAIVNSGNIHLYTYANVVDIVANEPVTRINKITTTNFDGKQLQVHARHFVFAAGAIQNARMLLAANKQAPNGLGNDQDLVGRYFMEHLEVTAADMLMPDDHPMKLYRTWVYGETKVRAELAITELKQEQYQLLNGTIALTPKEQASGVVSIDSFSDDAESTVRMWEEMERQRQRKRAREERFRFHEFELFTRMEQSPNPLSRVQLTRELDELGVPLITLDWKLTALDKKSIRKSFELLGQEMGKAGLGRIRLREWLQDESDISWSSELGGGWHHMGTTRMADDPKKGVVDSNCKVHGLDNLFIAGSSCFTTSGAANPTLSLIALSLRLSDHLKERIRAETIIATNQKQKNGNHV
jgi:choline dehydrogenase-like flavoprotein